jgi:magnesium chelatase family protein
VAAARDRSAHRLDGTPWRLNAEIPGAELRRSYPPEAGSMRQVERAMELGQVSARGASKILRVAWTIADLAGRDRPGKDEVQTALQLFLGEERA